MVFMSGDELFKKRLCYSLAVYVLINEIKCYATRARAAIYYGC